ncbi:MAG: aspartate aminotransferase family protein [Actinomycetaceae bacterium]|nr:aspartate aminotransferase family protein [Actinomycetaceae bacterium]
MAVELDLQRIQNLIKEESEKLNNRTQRSKEMYERARHHLCNGVGSTYQARDPWPIYIAEGSGPHIVDVDGNKYYDFHNGYGSMIQGHGHPMVMDALKERYPKGSHFGCATEEDVIVAEELSRRWGLPKWRFTNSGSESTMDAIRIARAYTGRDTIVKIFGSYHGHHDGVMVSIGVPYDKIGDRFTLKSLPYGGGIPQSIVDMTYSVHFNDAEAMERRIIELDKEGKKPACVIMEAAMMNLGVVLPEDGYLRQVRDICTRHNVVLIFDEVKTGMCIAAGGATEYFGVTPDLVTLAKALGAGLPSGAIGGTEEVMSVVEDGTVYQVGTFSGNPLSMAAAAVSLTEILTPKAYSHLDHLNDRIVKGCQAVIDKYDLPGYALGIQSKGCVTFSDTKITDYATYIANQQDALCDAAWVWNMNRGIFMTPGREEEWTLSVTHTDEAIDAYIAAFDSLAAELTR